MVKEVISLDELTEYKVSISTRKFIEVDGVEYQIGDIHRRGYANSADDRELIQNELGEPYLSAVMAVWGDTPTVLPPEDEIRG